MRRTATFAGLTLVLLLFALPAAAQDAGGQATMGTATWLVIASSFSMAIASAVCGIAQAKAAAAACEGIARNPGAADGIRFALILSLVLIESLALYTLLIFLIFKFLG